MCILYVTLAQTSPELNQETQRFHTNVIFILDQEMENDIL